MKVLYTLTILVFISNNFYTQEITKNIERSKSEKVIKIRDFNRNGFVLVTGHNKAYQKPKPSFKLYSYTNELKLNWIKEIKAESGFIQNDFETSLVTSKSGEYTYFVETNSWRRKKNDCVIHQINKKGGVNVHKIIRDESFGFNNASFANDKYFFLMNYQNNKTTKNGAIVNRFNKKYNTEKVIILQIAHGDFETKKIILDLPKFEDPKNSEFWEYLGHTETSFYLKRKIISKDKKSNRYDIYVFNNDGEYIRDFSIKINHTKKIIPINLNMGHSNADLKFNNDVEFESLGGGGSLMYSFSGAYGHIVFNQDDNSIYTFDYDKNNKLISTKNDSIGKLIWENSFDISSKELDENYKQTHYFSESNNSYYLSTYKNGTLINKGTGEMESVFHSEYFKHRAKTKPFLIDEILERKNGYIIIEEKKRKLVELSYHKR